MAAVLVESDKQRVYFGVDSGCLVEVDENRQSDVVIEAKGKGGEAFMAEIDTSAPFESVKEAVCRFGGPGYWKPNRHHRYLNNKLSPCKTPGVEDVDVTNVEDQAAELERELVLKEKETLQLLKELEATKMTVEELKSKLQIAETTAPFPSTAGYNPPAATFKPKAGEKEKENDPPCETHPNPNSEEDGRMILLQLKQAKFNLARASGDLTRIRSHLESCNSKIERGTKSLDRTSEELQLTTDSKNVPAELQRLKKQPGEAAKAEEAMRVMSTGTKLLAKIQATNKDIRSDDAAAARRMKEQEAAAAAIVEINALKKKSDRSSSFTNALLLEDPEEEQGITLAYEEEEEEYSSNSSLSCKYENCKEKSVDVGAVSAASHRMDILKRVEEAMEDLRYSEEALKEALCGVMDAEDDEINPVDDKVASPVPKSTTTLSIGQILSRKLLAAEVYELKGKKSGKRRKVSLGQMMLGKQKKCQLLSSWKVEKKKERRCGEEATRQQQLPNPTKRNRFGFASRLSTVLTKH